MANEKIRVRLKAYDHTLIIAQNTWINVGSGVAVRGCGV
jgi:ribosomal protein S10